MIPALFKKLFGSRNDRLLRQYAHTVRAINALEPGVSALSDAELRAKTDAFKTRYGNGETLDKRLRKYLIRARPAWRRPRHDRWATVAHSAVQGR